ncbi:hypothetical protein ANME2D_03139 [Candidatus Methanoperedens nitroreducens]|uniref:Uncharacterized protein n=1 Tax=Candidatus Methanoperedens nitratireducens TaxID=1392998 RepID=A0A062V145_9EURY|nr:DUF6544 family protein [Candidatus Methanoperedens nitroreducens]KCZ71107.1 hypothetical protein ANME2D_03139 [Candidatus Methanoperedens nitroreducens]
MNGIYIMIIAIISIAVILLDIGWLGFQIEPESFAPHPEKTKDIGSVELPPDLPEPVRRYYEAAAGSPVPRIDSAVVWGKAKLRINGIWMPVRFKAYYLPGQAFLRYMEVTWFGRTILKVSDSYINGEGVLKIEGLLNMKETGEKIDQGQNLAMWGEAVFTPSVVITDSRVHWEAVDNETMRLVVPFGEQNDELLFTFDQKTNLITHVSAWRFRGQEEEKMPWLIEFTEWKTFHSVKIPARFEVTWEDEGSPWSYWTVEGVEYNIDITDNLPVSLSIEQKEIKKSEVKNQS